MSPAVCSIDSAMDGARGSASSSSTRGDAGTYPSRQRDCVATAARSAETQGDASPLHTTPLPPLRGWSVVCYNTP